MTTTTNMSRPVCRHGRTVLLQVFPFLSHIERSGHQSDTTGTSARLNTIINYNLFQDRYRAILSPLAERIDKALQNVHKVFSPVFTPGEVNAASMQLDPAIKNRIVSGTFHRFEVQYLNDYLSDMVHAYLEFVEHAFDLIADCPADMQRFPKHLFVHFFDEISEPDLSPTTVYRTPYTQPTIYNGDQVRLEEAQTSISPGYIDKGLSNARSAGYQPNPHHAGNDGCPAAQPAGNAVLLPPFHDRLVKSPTTENGRTARCIPITVLPFHRITIPWYSIWKAATSCA